jgi:filamentous hemagglutinin
MPGCRSCERIAGNNRGLSPIPKSGEAANIVVEKTQAAAIGAGKPAIGAFSTPDPVADQLYARSKLAITPSMKGDVSMVQPVKATGKPMVTVQGKIAPQAPVSQHPGGGQQNFYDYPGNSIRTDYIKPVEPAKPLP